MGVDVIASHRRYRDAYEARDVERMVELFAEDAELTWPVGTFRGRAAIREVLAWDVRLSPTAAVRDVGVGVVASERMLAAEQIAALSAEGVPYQLPVVTVMEIDDEGLIRRMASYYDKLALMDQIASKYPGVRGRALRTLTGFLDRLGRRGLAVTST